MMGTQEKHIVVIGRHINRCYFCGAHTTLTQETFHGGNRKTLSVCYNCQKQDKDIPRRLSQNLRTVLSAAKQPQLEKWVTKH